MVRIHRKASGAGTWHVRHPVSVILASVGAVIFASAGSACSHADAANPSIAASGAGGNNGSNSSVAASGAGGNSGPDCPTDGVGGDSLPPPCVPSAGSSPGATSGTATGADGTQRTGAGPRPNVVVTAPGAMSAPGPGISGPATATPTPPPPGYGVAGPAAPSSPAPPTSPSSVTLLRVTGISPATGTAVGGTSVTITGSGFTGATEVEFGSVRADVTALSDTKITVTSPPGSGTVDITVVTTVGTSATDPADQFSYQS